MTTDNPPAQPLSKASIYLSVSTDPNTGTEIYSDARTHPDYSLVKAGAYNSDMSQFVLRNQTVDQYPCKPSQAHGLKAFAAYVASGYNTEKGASWPSHETITKFTGISRASISRYTKLLVDSGLWAVVPGSGKTSTRYYPLFLDGGNKAYFRYLQAQAVNQGDAFAYDLNDLDSSKRDDSKTISPVDTATGEIQEEPTQDGQHDTSPAEEGHDFISFVPDDPYINVPLSDEEPPDDHAYMDVPDSDTYYSERSDEHVW